MHNNKLHFFHKEFQEDFQENFYDVITVGSATVDVFVKTKGDILKLAHPDRPEEHMLVYPIGAKILIERKKTMTGGGGTNTAVSFARLGFKTAFLGKIGEDENGAKIIEQLKNEKVDFIGKKISSKISSNNEELTGYSVILDSIEDDRTILTYKGINDELKFSETNFGGGSNNLRAKWLYFSSMTGNSYKTLEKLAEKAHKSNTFIAFNPSSYLCKQGYAYLKKLLKLTTILILNLEEAELLTNSANPSGQISSPRYKQLPQRTEKLSKQTEQSSKRSAHGYSQNSYAGAVDAITADTIHLLRSLKSFGPSIIVITNGRQKVSAYDGHYFYSITPRKVKVVETTGAGDAFASAFVAGILLKNDISYGLKMGIVNSESIVTHFGAKTGLLTLKEIEQKMKKHPSKAQKTHNAIHFK